MSLPTKWEIAKYWHEHQSAIEGKYKKSLIYDLGEPACFACQDGWFGAYDKHGPAKAWNKIPLQRCHIVARQFGGSDTRDNIVLLCERCHKEQPDVPDADTIWRWISKRESYDVFWCSRVKNAMDSVFDNLDEAKEVMDWALAKGLDYFDIYCGVHFGVRLKFESIFAAARLIYSKEVRQL